MKKNSLAFIITHFLIVLICSSDCSANQINFRIIGTEKKLIERIEHSPIFKAIQFKNENPKKININWRFEGYGKTRFGEIHINKNAVIWDSKLHIPYRELINIFKNRNYRSIVISIFKGTKHWFNITEEYYGYQFSPPIFNLFDDSKNYVQSNKETNTKWESERESVNLYKEEIDRMLKNINKLKDEYAKLREVSNRIKNNISAIYNSRTESLVYRHLVSNLKKRFSIKIEVPNSEEQMEFVYVPKGSFKLGPTEKQLSQIVLSSANYNIEEVLKDMRFQMFDNGFFMGKYELTNREYMAFNLNHRSDDNKPVTNLSQKEIFSFLDFLNKSYPMIKFDLPSEREWEYAAKGLHEDRFYIWGNNFDKNKANVDSELLLRVGSMNEGGKSWCGAIDMIGNAAEICKLIPGIYKRANETEYVARGGAFFSSKYSSRLTTRHPVYASVVKEPGFGFRLVIKKRKKTVK